MKIDLARVVEYRYPRQTKYLQFLWQKTVEPPLALKDPITRNQVRRFNGLLVMIILVMLPVLGIQIWQSPIEAIVTSQTIRAIVGGVIVALIIYIMNHIIPSYRLMIDTAIGLGFVAIFTVALTSSAPHIEILFLIFLPLVSTILYPLRGTFILCALTLIGLVIFGLVVSDMPGNVLKNMVVLMTLTHVFILFVAQQRNRLEQDRQQLALEEARNALLKGLIANLSHDFRTPLSIINVNAYLVERIEDRAQQREKTRMIIEQTMRLNKLMDDIFTISRLEHTLESGQETFELNSLLRQIVDRFQPKAAQKNLRMVSAFAPDKLPVHANRDDLYRVFASIIENALEYTLAGGSITICTQFTEDQAVTEIIDTGVGINPQDLALIFDSFFRGDRARSMDTGVGGLGLAIAKRVVEMHHGNITVESQPAQGSTFRIALPLAANTPEVFPS